MANTATFFEGTRLLSLSHRSTLTTGLFLSGQTPLRNSSALRINVLDSSFNPPTLAHLALALSHVPKSTNSQNAEAQSSTLNYDAHLLLLSVTNADKSLKAGDARFAERVEMMILMTKAMQVQEEDRPSARNLAVAVINEPTFVGKSTKLLQYLNGPSKNVGEPRTLRLTFILGTDTITRFFAPRFYPSKPAMEASLRRFFLSPDDASAGEGEGSQIACARRAGALLEEEESALLQSDEVRPYVEAGGVAMMDIAPEEAAMSSTRVREVIRRTHEGYRDDWETMCLPEVAEYIKTHHLYWN